MPKESGTLVRLGDGSRFLRLYRKFKAADEPVRASRHRLAGKIAETFGWHNESSDDFPSPGRPAGTSPAWYSTDQEVVDWALAEIAAGAPIKPYGLPARYWDEHPEVQHGEKATFVQRLGPKIKDALR